MTPISTHPDEDVLLGYVAGTLPEPQQSAFEDHLFGCDECLAHVERLQAAQGVLATRDPHPTIAEPIPFPSEADPRDRPVRSRSTWWLTGSVAAFLVAGLMGAVLWRPSAQPETTTASAEPAAAVPVTDPRPEPTAPATPPPSAGTTRQTREAPVPAQNPGQATQESATTKGLRMAVLAMVTPPPYLPLVTRDGAAPADRFDEGMTAYVARDWTRASQVLSDVDRPQARFYKGVADLMRGATADAAQAFEAVRRGGQEPWATESLFYLGKAAVQQGRVEDARQWFAASRDASSSQSREATRLLAALDEFR